MAGSPTGPEPQDATADITVVIVAYNSRKALAAQIDFLAALPRLVVVDNASSDGTAAWLAEALPSATVWRLRENVGFGRAHNFAVQRCTTTFALLLNPDCQLGIEDLHCLRALLQACPDALMAVPALYYPDGSAQENHRPFFHERQGARGPYRSPDGSLCCAMTSGAVLLVRVATFLELGGFDPWFFLYWEDEDLCLRARAARRAVLLEPRARACHVAQTSSVPSLRTTFLRHYCYGGSKLHLRRKLGESRPRLVARAMGTLLSSLIALPLQLLTGRRQKAVRSVARIAAMLTAPLQLRRQHAVAMPSQLLRRHAALPDPS